MTATLRALGALDEREEIRGGDNLAAIFLPEERKGILKEAATRAWVIKEKTSPGMYEYMLARTAWFDHVIKGGLSANIPQVVFLGAGYDSRPYRFMDLIRDTRIFELDAGPTQKRKVGLLQQAKIPIPENLKFVEVNFNSDDLGQTLFEAGYHSDQEALFVWEGVTYYLAAEVVDSILNLIRSISPPGSSVCFDYAAFTTQALSEEGVKQTVTRIRSESPGERPHFGIPAGTIEPFLVQRGYQILEHLTSKHMESRFLTLKDGSLAGNAPSLFCLVQAAVRLPVVMK